MRFVFSSALIPDKVKIFYIIINNLYSKTEFGKVISTCILFFFIFHRPSVTIIICYWLYSYAYASFKTIFSHLIRIKSRNYEGILLRILL